MRILVTGVTGQLGYDVVKEGKLQGLDLIGIGSRELDVTDEVAVSSYVSKIKPDAIIHCAAYTAVDKAEDEKEKCYHVNVSGTKYLAAAAQSINAKFLYISTDYVFNGQGQKPFTELDDTEPIGYYGLTKLKGEQVVQDLLSKWFIVRISWVFGLNGTNFIKTMLRLSETRNELNVVGDQIGSPTYTHDLSKLLIEMIKTDKYGIYHASNEGDCSWADFAKEIFNQAGREVVVNPIPSEEYPTKAVRPKNSKMSKQKLLEHGFQPLPEWKDGLKRYLTELQLEVN